MTTEDSQQQGEKDDGCMLAQLSHLVKVSEVLGLCYSDINFTESFEAGEWLFSREYDGWEMSNNR